MGEPRRVVCTLGVGRHEELVEIGRPLLERYALRHGYDVVVRVGASPAPDRPPAWGKVVVVRELLERYDTVVWIDADAIVVDPRDDIAVVRAGRPSRPARPLSLVHHVVGGVVVPNTGVLVAERSAGAVALLERMWHRTEWIDHRWWDNAALIDVVGGDGDVGLTTRAARWRAARRLGRLDLRWNSIPPCRAARPAIVHLAGVSDEERRRVMPRLVERALEGAATP